MIFACHPEILRNMNVTQLIGVTRRPIAPTINVEDERCSTSVAIFSAFRGPDAVNHLNGVAMRGQDMLVRPALVCACPLCNAAVFWSVDLLSRSEIRRVFTPLPVSIAMQYISREVANFANTRIPTPFFSASNSAHAVFSNVVPSNDPDPVIWDGGVTSCSVCMSDLCRGDRVLRLACMHVFHAGCWQHALEQGVAARCPNCRAPSRIVAVFHHIPVDSAAGAASTPADPFETRAIATEASAANLMNDRSARMVRAGAVSVHPLIMRSGPYAAIPSNRPKAKAKSAAAKAKSAAAKATARNASQQPLQPRQARPQTSRQLRRDETAAVCLHTPQSGQLRRDEIATLLMEFSEGLLDVGFIDACDPVTIVSVVEQILVDCLSQGRALTLQGTRGRPGEHRRVTLMPNLTERTVDVLLTAGLQQTMFPDINGSPAENRGAPFQNGGA
jgi:hypothetical protein